MSKGLLMEALRQLILAENMTHEWWKAGDIKDEQINAFRNHTNVTRRILSQAIEDR
jgi:hypothetical protein